MAAHTIRDLKEEDVTSVVRIYIDSWNEGFRDLMPHREVDAKLVERWRGDLQKPTHKWSVAVVDDIVAGFVGVGPSRDPVRDGLGELDTIAVDPPLWRRGIGRSLMTLAISQLRTDYDAAILWTLESYDQGQRFYEATGWCRDGGVRDEGRQIRFALYQP